MKVFKLNFLTNFLKRQIRLKKALEKWNFAVEKIAQRMTKDVKKLN